MIIDRTPIVGRILVIDDNAESRNLLARRLGRQGHSVATATGGESAIEILHRETFEVILLDLVMEDMSGLELLGYLKSHSQLKHLPVIVVSSSSNMHDVVDCIEAGAEDYLPRPVESLVLHARINASLLKKRMSDKERSYREEIDMLQHIDRELNETLDSQRVMQILLNWAIQQGDEEAALAGIVEPSGIRVLSSYGYISELERFNKAVLPLDSPPLNSVIRTGRMYFSFDVEDAGILTDAVSQLIVPIVRKGEVLGVLMLESSVAKRWRPDVQRFVIRLCDHAAIALANSMLYQSLQEANNAKSDFVSFVSHELKTPMTAIRGYAELLASGQAGPIAENQVNHLGTIQANVDRMARLVADLSDISQIEAGRLQLEVEGVCINNVIKEVAKSLFTYISDKSQTLNLVLADEVPDVWGDFGRLVQVVTNLLSNASKYTPDGGTVTVHSEQMMFAIPGRTKQPMLHVSVADNGIGIPEEEQRNIFTKFFRSNDEVARERPGTGLGLSITKQLIEMHEGYIWFESRFRIGTTFHFVIPIPDLS